jgi:hypothetical protein
LTTLNRLGVAHESFLVDVYPSLQTQFFPVTAATITLGEEHALADTPVADGFGTKIERLVDFDARFELSSTTLPASAADVKQAGMTGRYEKVGVRPVRFEWSGTLALGAGSEILGGRWTGDPANGPDAVMFVEGEPCVGDAGTLELNPSLSLAPIERLAELSRSDAPGEIAIEARDLFWEASDAGSP